MVSQIYTAKEFYKKQKKGELLKGRKDKYEKLFYDSKKKKYYVYYRTKDNKSKKVYIKAGDFVYSRGTSNNPNAGGVAVYDSVKDKQRIARWTMDKEKWLKYPSEYDYYGSQ